MPRAYLLACWCSPRASEAIRRAPKGWHLKTLTAKQGPTSHPALLVEIHRYRPKLLQLGDVRPLHDRVAGHVRSGPAVGFHGGCLQDPTRFFSTTFGFAHNDPPSDSRRSFQ